MNRAIILHGTDGKPESNWFIWLKEKFEAEGYEVWVPQLPDCHVPSWQKYNDFLLSGKFDFTDSIVIGHSSGAVEVLNLLSDGRCPHIRFGLLVSGWESGPAIGMDASQFSELFPPSGYDYSLIKTKAHALSMIHGSNDPYVPLQWAQNLAQKLDVKLTVVPNGHHLGAAYSVLPEIWQIIEPHV